MCGLMARDTTPMVSTTALEKLTRLVHGSRRILLVSHQNCGDATGAVAACLIVLERLGKVVTPYLPAPVPKSFCFLPRTEEIRTDLTTVRLEDYDLLLCVDAAEPSMTGLGDRFAERPTTLTTVNFDHHLTNPEYGDFNVVDRSAAATCAMLYEWFQFAGFNVDYAVATCLLTGILTDTGSFSNPATNDAALATASHLLLKGASVTQVLERVVRNKTIPELKLWGRALERLRVDQELGLVTTVVTQADVEELGGSPEALEGIANFLNELEGFRAVMVLKEQPDGSVKGSLRTTRDDVDVAAMAKLFGGGGHKKAAGFTVPGRLIETERGWELVR